MGPAELAELQPLHKGIPPWVGREVQNGLGSKDQHLPGSVRNFSSYLGQILQSF